ncbi:Polyketide cyclase / dehydrase and lipid transport family protein [Clavispora lusitaniae]|uniref:Coenzyme Q-binding protein COQ10 START domain-containing protein n=1 Tax=Clavispora lusitaniae (strain ATCC 42720) TaxID=306902 RepID=C4Y2X0_CLAL4|nr:uncharacterized protein CLUG_02883 [Clavispora lusitaniae ATCC 42720]EEQ38757.1 hypothetical protein CLUG_02883 [Clavispora lusitaniae ATCC 42720]KAF7579868.1 Polyketide cyclase / dehydrase and lipid transport family protein [Clavispora lusitaniae]
MLSLKAPLISSRRSLFNFAQTSSQSYKVSKKINVPPSLLFEIVSDVSLYHEFVPFVTHSFINEYSKETNLPTEAGLRVGWKQYDEKFTCKLTCVKDKKVISESITISLFDHLYNEWNFKEVKNRFTNESSTYMELLLRYKFKNPVYNTVSSLFQSHVSELMIKAFEERALDLKIQRKMKDRIN